MMGWLRPLAMTLAVVISTAATTVAQPTTAVAAVAVPPVPAALKPQGVGSGTTYYVSPTGKDTNDGKATTRPFRTLQKAANVVNPGDVVSIMNGEYSTNKGPNPTDPAGKYPVLEIRRSGTAAKWITFRAHPGHKPVVFTRNWHGIQVRGASYILLEGLTVRGDLYGITYNYAYSQRKNVYNPLVSANGITVMPELWDPVFPHHVVVRNNLVYEIPGGGIVVGNADYILVEGNTVHHTSWWSPFGKSGISVWQSKSWDNTTGHKIFVQKNTVYDVENKIPFYALDQITDGHGIIVDDTESSEWFPKNSPYRGKTLIWNNNVNRIGARGFNAFRSRNVDVIANRFTNTSRTPGTLKASISVIFATNILIAENVLDYPNHFNWESTGITSTNNKLP